MNEKETYAVTGAFSYTGKYITRLLLERNKNACIINITGHPNRQSPFGGSVKVLPFNFDDYKKLVSALKGVRILFNTYWVRFSHRDNTFGQAVANVQNLIRAAAEAGVERFVHISITNPSTDSAFAYFRGKAIMEETLIQSGLSYAIIRPTLIFGKEDILINNIAWLLKKYPLYMIFGDGEYRVQPVYVGDVAKMAVELSDRNENIICDAVGPETYSFGKLVRLIKQRVGGRAKIINANPKAAFYVSKVLNLILRDVVVTYEEIYGLMAETLVAFGRSTCETLFSQWSKEHASELGVSYSSELKRHYNKDS